MGWIDDDTFEFWMPAQAIEIAKGGKNGSKKDNIRWIQGIASTSARDLQGEVIEQKGIDFAYFLNHGFFNWDHKEGPEHKVGEPTECKLTKNGLWVKGFIWKGADNSDLCDNIWRRFQTFAKNPHSKRKMGFSIQGKVKRRAGNVIKECWLQDIAITMCPVNTTTWAEIAKSLAAQKWEDDDTDKTVTAQGNVMVPESLEGKQKEDRDDVEKSATFTFQESVAYIESATGMSRGDAEATARAIFSVITKE